jgi:hypothetical protein
VCPALGIGVRAQLMSPGRAPIRATPRRPAAPAGGSHPSYAYSSQPGAARYHLASVLSAALVQLAVVSFTAPGCSSGSTG